MPNFKSPFPDGIPNFWLKQLDAHHNHYARAFNKLIQEKKVMDEWLTEGNTFLFPKSEETQRCHKYRPIMYTNNTETSEGNHHRNYVPRPNTTRRPKGRTGRMQERM